MKIKRPEMFTQAESSRGNSAVSYDDSETYGIYNER